MTNRLLVALAGLLVLGACSSAKKTQQQASYAQPSYLGVARLDRGEPVSGNRKIAEAAKKTKSKKSKVANDPALKPLETYFAALRKVDVFAKELRQKLGEEAYLQLVKDSLKVDKDFGTFAAAYATSYPAKAEACAKAVAELKQIQVETIDSKTYLESLRPVLTPVLERLLSREPVIAINTNNGETDKKDYEIFYARLSAEVEKGSITPEMAVVLNQSPYAPSLQAGNGPDGFTLIAPFYAQIQANFMTLVSRKSRSENFLGSLTTAWLQAISTGSN